MRAARFATPLRRLFDRAETRARTSALARLDRHWDLLTVVVAGYILVGVSNIQLLLPFLSPLRLGIVCAVGSAGLWIASTSRARRMTGLADATTKALLVLLVWTAITVPFALHRGLAFTLVKDGFSRTVLLYLVIVGCVRGFRDLERLVFVHFTGIVLYAFYTLTFTSITVSTARVEHIVGNYDPNDFATFAVSGLPFALYFLSRFHPWWIRAFAAGGLALTAMGVVLSGSRGGFLALLAAGAYILFKYDSISLRARVGSVAVALLAMTAIASDDYWTRIGTIVSVEDDYNLTAEEGRTKIWRRGINYAMEYPVFGVGVGNFSYAEATISPLVDRGSGLAGRFLAPHNSFVQIFAELGFFGISVFAYLLYNAMHGLRLHAAALSAVVPRAAPLGQALTASMLGLLVGIFFLSHAYSSMLYTVVALAVAYAKVGRMIPAVTRPH